MTKITVVKEVTFEAAHHLPDYDGPCARSHGHHYRLQVGFRDYARLDGMVVDFSSVKSLVNEVVDYLDHSYLNEVSLDFGGGLFPGHTPTAENMVEWFKETFDYLFFKYHAELSFIRLYETPTSYAEWRKE